MKITEQYQKELASIQSAYQALPFIKRFLTKVFFWFFIKNLVSVLPTETSVKTMQSLVDSVRYKVFSFAFSLIIQFKQTQVYQTYSKEEEVVLPDELFIERPIVSFLRLDEAQLELDQAREEHKQTLERAEQALERAQQALERERQALEREQQAQKEKSQCLKENIYLKFEYFTNVKKTDRTTSLKQSLMQKFELNNSQFIALLDLFSSGTDENMQKLDQNIDEILNKKEPFSPLLLASNQASFFAENKGHNKKQLNELPAPPTTPIPSSPIENKTQGTI